MWNLTFSAAIKSIPMQNRHLCARYRGVERGYSIARTQFLVSYQPVPERSN